MSVKIPVLMIREKFQKSFIVRLTTKFEKFTLRNPKDKADTATDKEQLQIRIMIFRGVKCRTVQVINDVVNNHRNLKILKGT